MLSLTSGSTMEGCGSPPSRSATSIDPPRATAPSLSSPAKMLNKPFLTSVRKFVSGNRSRVEDTEFNLDMSYITDRVIAMSYPAAGLEGVFRNPRHQVRSYLEKHHFEKFLLFNLCGESRYQYATLEFARVVNVPIKRGSVPSLYQVANFCQQAQNWLAQQEDHVVVIHCVKGTGRTGMMVACLLVALGICETAQQAIDTFNAKRGGNQLALNTPSKKRWVRLFAELMVLSSHSVPISIAALGQAARYSWRLDSIQLGPTRWSVQSVAVRPRSNEKEISVALPELFKQRNQSSTASFVRRSLEGTRCEIISLELAESGGFSCGEDCWFSIRLRRGASACAVNFWFCGEMSQTMINHRCSDKEGRYALILNGQDLDTPGDPETMLGCSEVGFFVKVHVKFSIIE